MKRLEDIKENIPKIINFAPMGVLIAVVYMVMINALILDKNHKNLTYHIYIDKKLQLLYT